jgi:hypothetical protein
MSLGLKQGERTTFTVAFLNCLLMIHLQQLSVYLLLFADDIAVFYNGQAQFTTPIGQSLLVFSKMEIKN